MKTWVGLIVIRDRKLLMVWEQDIARWVLPGGEMEEGENIESTLLRECREEVNTVPIDYKEFDEYVLSVGDKEKKFVLFIGELRGKIEPNGDVVKVSWFDSRVLESDEPLGVVTKQRLLTVLKDKNLIN